MARSAASLSTAGPATSPADRLDARLRAAVCVALLAGPVLLAFRSGGVGDQARSVAAVLAWGLLAMAALGWRRAPVPRSAPGVVAVLGLAGLTLWVTASSAWATLAGPALDDRVRLAFYLGAFLLAATAWPSRRSARRAEPALAAGAVALIVYALSERLVPDLVSLDASLGAGGLLEQPITYWNATGAAAATGFVLCARLAGDATRPPGARTVAAAAVVPLGAGLALTQSRGALAALAVGLVVLTLLAPERRQLRAVLLSVAAGVAAGGVALALPAVRTLEGGAAERRVQGLVALAILILLAGAAAVAQRRLAPARGRAGLPRPGRALAPLAALGLASVLVPAVAGASGSSVGGNRDQYWEVALRAFASDPLAGAGTGSFVTEWAREGDIAESVRDAHSLYLETAAELGVVGLVALGLFVGGVAVAGTRAHRRDGALASGACAALVVFAVHAAVDWDWEVPAVTLPALVLAGLLVWREGAPPVSGRVEG